MELKCLFSVIFLLLNASSSGEERKGEKETVYETERERDKRERESEIGCVRERESNSEVDRGCDTDS